VDVPARWLAEPDPELLAAEVRALGDRTSPETLT
jgi:hypothetical protein